MVSYNKLKIIDYLRKNQTVVDTAFLRQLTGLKNKQSLASFIRSLKDHGIIETAERGKYLVKENLGNDFVLANALYQPSYISLETALNLYGMLAQFPAEISSVTPKRTNRKTVAGKQYAYYHINPRLYFGYELNNGALIAMAEKALLDNIYFAGKGIKEIDLEELDLSLLKVNIFKSFSHKFPQTRRFINYSKKILKLI